MKSVISGCVCEDVARRDKPTIVSKEIASLMQVGIIQSFEGLNRTERCRHNFSFLSDLELPSPALRCWHL